MEMNFCRRCGTVLTHKSEGMYACQNGHTLFSNAAPTVGVFFVTDDKKVLLAVRGIEPAKGMLDTPGGFIDINETAEDALARELEEELGLSPEQYETPQFLCTVAGDYPYGGEVRIILSTIFWSRLKPTAKPVARDDVASFTFIPLNAVNLDDIGGKDIKIAIQKLQKQFL